MNCPPHETKLNAPEPDASGAAAIAQELRTFWHGILRDSERASHIDRQQFWVLKATDAGPIRMSQLAEHAQTSQASLTGIVDRLEDRGLVQRTRSSEDRRVVEVSLTDAGRTELKRMQSIFAGRLEAAFAVLSPDECDALLGTLRKLNAAAGHPDRP